MKINIRELKESDVNFILATWCRSAYSNATGYREKQSIFHKGLERVIKRRYEQGDLLVYIACDSDDPDFILGFAVFGYVYSLHYVYVKEAFKRLGVAKALLSFFYKNKKEITVSFWTKDIDHIKKMYQVTYDRFKFFN